MFIDSYNAFVAVFIAIMTAVLGQYWYLFIPFSPSPPGIICYRLLPHTKPGEALKQKKELP